MTWEGVASLFYSHFHLLVLPLALLCKSSVDTDSSWVLQFSRSGTNGSQGPVHLTLLSLCGMVGTLHSFGFLFPQWAIRFHFLPWIPSALSFHGSVVVDFSLESHRSRGNLRLSKDSLMHRSLIYCFMYFVLAHICELALKGLCVPYPLKHSLNYGGSIAGKKNKQGLPSIWKICVREVYHELECLTLKLHMHVALNL